MDNKLDMNKMEAQKQLSAEQLERQEKPKKLFDMMKSLFESISNSNDRYEIKVYIKEFENKFNKQPENKKQSLVLQDYLLGRVLTDLNSEDYDLNSPLDNNGQIEEFINKLCGEQKEEDK